MGKRKRGPSRLRPPEKASCSCGYNCGYYFLRCDNCHRGCHFQCLGLKVEEARRLNVYVCPACERSGVEAADVEAKCRAGNKPRAVVYEVLCNVHAENTAKKERTQKCYAIGYAIENNLTLKDDPCCICGYVCKSQLVSCDRCDADYHCMCMGLSEKDVDGIDEFYCPKCLASNPQLRITYKDAGEAAQADHDGAADQPGPSGVQTGPSTSTHSSDRHVKRVRREVHVKCEQPDEDATSCSGVSQSNRDGANQSNQTTAGQSNRASASQSNRAADSQNNRATAIVSNRAADSPSNRAAASQSSRAAAIPNNRSAASTGATIPVPQPEGRPIDGIPTSGPSKQVYRTSTLSASRHVDQQPMENDSGPSVPSPNPTGHGNRGREPTAADLMRVLYERQVDDKQKEIDALQNQLRLKDADLDAERATRTQAQEENARLKQENAKKDKTIVDLTMELFELKRSM